MATRFDIVIDQGSPFNLEIDLFDANDDAANTAGWTGAAKMRKHYQSSNSYVFTANVSGGMLVLTMTSSYTTNIVPGRYVYDAEIIYNDQETSRIVEGIATVTPEVTY